MGATTGGSSIRYVIVSPVKDEEKYISLTLQSVINQSIKPVLWIIVDDGSIDKTSEIINGFLAANTFIRYERNPKAGERKLAFAEIQAFNRGCRLIDSTDYDFIVKLDCDLSFDTNYFEQLLEKFRMDEKLGIASGVYLEPNRSGIWQEVIMPSYHAAGASKVVRKECFEQIGGFIPAPGWDTVDEIRAMSRGWRTTHFSNLKMYHHKPEGSSIGVFKNSFMQGEAYYRSGGSLLFFVFKAIRRFLTFPFMAGGFGLIWGYLKAVLDKKPPLVKEPEARYYNAQLLKRLKAKAKSFFKKTLTLHK
ncbi:glycosyltransferase family 2 protein [Desulfococcus sp.]|uniref:glycosyltransferase family 2 protein n=1 Tax=Desulfococcus sp. TaxID=2025834 RepID=UPI00359405A8